MFSNDGGQEIATRFVVTQTVTLRSLTWFGGHPGAFEPLPSESDYRSDYRILLFEDVDNGPAATPLRRAGASVKRVLTGANFEGRSPWFSYSADLDAIRLEPGSYWLSVVYLGNNSDWLWASTASASGAGSVFRGGASQTWRGSGNPKRAFILYGVSG